MSQSRALWSAVVVAISALTGCAGNGQGLDQNGQPIGSGGSSTPLTADLASIEANVFTPICSRCHIGAGAPEGLQLDAAHAYDLLVGVPSVEDPSLLRVKPGAPDDSYMVLKIQGSPGIVGVRMPFGGPYLSQATIDVIRQWITDGAANVSQSAALARLTRERSVASLALTFSSPEDGATVSEPVTQVIVAFNHELDATLINETTVALERLRPGDDGVAASEPVGAALALALGNPEAILIIPTQPLGPGAYRITLRGSGGGALADLNAITLGRDLAFSFSVDGQP
jgi:hypothetical protein